MDDGFTGISTDNRAVALKRFQYLMKWSGNADMVSIFPSIILCIKFFISLSCLRFDNLIFFSFFLVLFSCVIEYIYICQYYIYMHGVRDRYTIKRKKNNKGEELKKIVGWI